MQFNFLPCEIIQPFERFCMKIFRPILQYRVLLYRKVGGTAYAMSINSLKNRNVTRRLVLGLATGMSSPEALKFFPARSS
jgi:hypothetical protein